MQKKQLTVLSEGGQVFGFGHITRCLSISKVFQDYGYTIHFIVNGDASLSSILKNTQYLSFPWQSNQDKLFKELSNTSLILIDSIEISNYLLLQIQELNIPIIFIDDDTRRNVLTKGIVVDWTILCENKDYFNQRKQKVSYLLGSTYTPLREEFNKASHNKIKEKIQSIMITFGGSDTQNIMPKILNNLNIHFPNIHKNVVIGSGFQNLKEIQKYKDKTNQFIFNADAKTMIDLMQTSDLAIASGGQTLYELARIGLPTIAILLVENAKDDTQGWHSVGALKNIGWYHQESLVDSLIDTIHCLENKEQRLQMQEKARKYTNPDGAKFLVDTILKELS